MISKDEWEAAAKAAEAHEAKVAKAVIGKKPAKEPVKETPPAEEPAAEVEEPAEEPSDPEAKAEPGEPADDDAEEPKGKPDDDKPVYGKERLKFRAEKRKHAEQIARERQAIADERAKLTAELEPVIQAKRAVELGDFDGLAKAFGFKDWNEANKRFLEESSSPGYKRLRQTEEQLERMQAKEREEREAAARARQQQEYQAQRQRNAAALATDMKAMEGLASDCADDPVVVDLVLQRIEKEFAGRDSVTHEEIAEVVPELIEQVLEQALQVHSTWQARVEKHADDARVRKFLGRRPSENAESRPRERTIPESRGPQRVNRGNPKPSHSRTSEAGGREMTEAEWRRQAIEDLRKSNRDQA